MSKKLCINRLKEDHLVRRCRGARACLLSGRGKRHHSLLHPPPAINQEVITPSFPTPKETTAGNVLGWTLIRLMNLSPVHSEIRVNLIAQHQEMISTALKRMYDAEFTESLSSTKQTLSIEDHRALAILESFMDYVGSVHYGLVMGKSRVAPLKAFTIPWMKLIPAVVSVKMHKFRERTI